MFKPVKRKGTGKLLRLLSGLDDKPKEELLQYIGLLEGNELKLLKFAHSFVKQFDEKSFDPRTEAGHADQRWFDI